MRLLPSCCPLLLLLPCSWAAGFVWGSADTSATTKQTALGPVGVILSPSSSSNCSCVPTASCLPAHVVLDGAGLLDLRAGPRQCASNQVCCLHPAAPPAPAPLTTDCGVSSPLSQPYRSGRRGTTKIVATTTLNTVAAQGEFPWMVAVLDATTGKLLCGGSLVDEWVVLTAAHCVAGRPLSSLKARLGEWDASTTSELYPSTDIPVRKVVSHPDYYAPGVFNDVALLLLTTMADTSLPNIGVSCLPFTDDTFHLFDCVVLGWGKEQFNAAGISAVLRKTKVPLVPHRDCEVALQNARLGSRFRLHESFLCAGGQAGLDACTGDGGGPLLCPLGGEQQTWIQVGVVSWGLGCGGPVPGVYADVQRLSPWIEAEITKDDLSRKSFILTA